MAIMKIPSTKFQASNSKSYTGFVFFITRLLHHSTFLSFIRRSMLDVRCSMFIFSVSGLLFEILVIGICLLFEICYLEFPLS